MCLFFKLKEKYHEIVSFYVNFFFTLLLKKVEKNAIQKYKNYSHASNYYESSITKQSKKNTSCENSLYASTEQHRPLKTIKEEITESSPKAASYAEDCKFLTVD